MVRRKQRYLLLQIDAEGRVAMSIPGGKDITERLKESVTTVFYNVAHLSTLAVIYYRQETGLAVLRCERIHTKLLESTMAMFTSGLRHDIRIQVVRVFGSIDPCRKGMLSFTQKRLDSFGPEYVKQFHFDLEKEIQNADLG
ncbi:unnamed protein product [Albugo candida]|uniref:Ribonuclease P/MRP protein subunit POP5 n=1 Tax=Albugo candida TaxID=65357 RepID=A0A024FZR1_9STRA|nr:unnamed protein product [Albugo candida]|eukprot:CCI39991.1 unnamed protein product [Albugo candida]